MMDRDLSQEELRVLGSLVEKEATTPEQYPLSINAVRSACNQKSSRDPVLALTESDVRAAIGSLTRRGLVRTASGYGGRVSKFAHRFGAPASGLELDAGQIAVLCVLFLRGAQTPGELRARTQRLHAYADTGEVEATLHALEQHPEGPLVRRLPREPGKREHRYLHCFGATPDASREGGGSDLFPTPRPEPAAPHPTATADLESRVEALEDALQAMEKRIEQLIGSRDDDGQSS